MEKKAGRPKKANSGPVLNDFFGLGGNPFGFPLGAFGGPTQGSAVESANTIFADLRWYLISNMRQVLSQLYVEIGLVQTLVDVPVDDAMRGGIMIKSQQLEEDQIQELGTRLDRDNVFIQTAQAAKWNRLFGGAALLILTDQDPLMPLNVDAIGQDTPLEFRAVDMWELFSDKANLDQYSGVTNLDLVEYYNYYGQKIHKSRVMILRGIDAPSLIRPRMRGFGVSVVEQGVRSLNQYLKATDLAFQVLDEFKIDVFKIKNLASTLLSSNGEQKVRQRLRVANAQKNYLNALVMDTEDDWDHKQLDFSGLAVAMEQIRMQISAEWRMPSLKLWGTPAQGLNASDESSMEVYNAMVESQVRHKIKYDLLRVCELKCQQLFGMIPDDMMVEFKPLRVLSAEQEETVKTAKFQRLYQARDKGDITPFEFREACNKGNLFDITLDNAGDELNPDDPDVSQLVKGDIENKDEEAEGDEPVVNSLPSTGQILNSLGFTKAAYQAEGGDSLFDAQRTEIFKEPLPLWVDKAKWEKAKKKSCEIYGRNHIPFTVWMYHEQGGKRL